VGEVPSNTTVLCVTELHPPLFHKHFGMEHLKFNINKFIHHENSLEVHYIILTQACKFGLMEVSINWTFCCKWILF